MNPKTKISAKSFSPVFCIMGSSLLAAAYSAIIGILVVSDMLKTDSMGYGKLAAPILFLFTAIMFFFYAWTPILTVALIICGIVPKLRRSGPWWIWACSIVVWAIAIVPFYFCVHFIQTSGGLAKYRMF